MILIDLCEITKDGKILGIYATTSSDYKFYKIIIEHFPTKFLFDLSGLLEEDSKIIDFPIDLSELFSLSTTIEKYPRMFKVSLTACKSDEDLEGEELEEITKEVIVSDVSMIYRYLLDLLSSICCSSCKVEIPVEVQRSFSILYAYNQAIELGLYDTALFFLNTLYKNFSKCNNLTCGRSSTTIHSNSCGCHE